MTSTKKKAKPRKGGGLVLVTFVTTADEKRRYIEMAEALEMDLDALCRLALSNIIEPPRGS